MKAVNIWPKPNCFTLQVGAHLACSSFLRSDCPRALVSGVNLTIRAETTAVLSKAGMLTQVGSLFLIMHTWLAGNLCMADLIRWNKGLYQSTGNTGIQNLVPNASLEFQDAKA